MKVKLLKGGMLNGSFVVGGSEIDANESDVNDMYTNGWTKTRPPMRIVEQSEVAHSEPTPKPEDAHEDKPAKPAKPAKAKESK